MTQFWADLEKLQAIQKDHKNFGFFGQVLDSTDSAAIQAEAKKHGITFPVVYAVDPDWEKVYQVGKREPHDLLLQPVQDRLVGSGSGREGSGRD